MISQCFNIQEIPITHLFSGLGYENISYYQASLPQLGLKGERLDYQGKIALARYIDSEFSPLVGTSFQTAFPPPFSSVLHLSHPRFLFLCERYHVCTFYLDMPSIYSSMNSFLFCSFPSPPPLVLILSPLQSPILLIEGL